MAEKYNCCLSPKEREKDDICKICEGYYNGLDCECAEMNKGRSEQRLVEKLQLENQQLKNRLENTVLAHVEEKRIKTMKNINELATVVHENAKAHGWWDNAPTFPETIALCHAELSEALEEYRNSHATDEVYYNGSKPEGIPIEMADVIIRILDWAESCNVDMEEAIRIKHEYNRTRPYRHGGKRV